MWEMLGMVPGSGGHLVSGTQRYHSCSCRGHVSLSPGDLTASPVHPARASALLHSSQRGLSKEQPGMCHSRGSAPGSNLRTIPP